MPGFVLHSLKNTSNEKCLLSTISFNVEFEVLKLLVIAES